MSAESVATANRLFAEANEIYLETNNKVGDITSRLSSIRNRLSEITRLRVADKATGQEADEFILLTSDAELLANMLTEAQKSAQELYAATNLKLNDLRAAERNHELEQAGIEFTALSLKLREIEAVYVKAIGATHAAGKKIGHFHLSQSWRPGEILDRAIRLNMPPESV